MEKKIEDLILDFKKLKESNNIECKLSKNTFPKEALKTYSAFSNSDGGILILGVEERNNEFIPVGVEDSSKIKKELFDALNNKAQVSKNILDDCMVLTYMIDGKEIIFINIPRASYKDKPIYLYNDFRLSYKRNHEGDYKCSDEEIKKMMRDSSEESLDTFLLEGFSIDDLDIKTIKSYRQRFALLKSEHAFNTMTDEEFLKKLRVLTKNRKNNKLEVSMGGMLVFGKNENIKEVLPHFHLEYIDKSNISMERWKDRIIYDGTWGEGNLYNFFFIVIEKLFSSLDKPFEIQEDKISRKENSNVHIALREAFINSIIHADFKIQEGIKITKHYTYFEFENPGQLRISKEDFFKGEHSKPRNNIIQEIFRHINLCERAGSGVPKILKAVREKAYRYPEIEEKDEKFIFRFWNIGLIENMKNISRTEHSILEYMIKFEKITNKDVRDNFGLKKHEIVELFNTLIEKDYIERVGAGRGAHYIIKYSSENDKKIRDILKINEKIEKIKKGAQ